MKFKEKRKWKTKTQPKIRTEYPETGGHYGKVQHKCDWNKWRREQSIRYI